MVGCLSVEEEVSGLVIDVSPSHSRTLFPVSLEWNIVMVCNRGE